MYAKNKSQRVFICTMAILLPLLLTSLVAHGLATAEGGVRVPTDRPTQSVANGITSDDFNSCELNTGLWTFENPLGDSSYEMVNTFSISAALAITVPGGADKHSISDSNTNAPRMMQAVSDGSANFVVETKIDSTIDQRFQVQGILVEGSGTDEFIRFEYFSNGPEIHVYAATLANGTLTERNNTIIPAADAGESYFLRVERSGDQWTQSYKKSSTNWLSLSPFTYALNVDAVGPYAGNSGNPPTSTVPAHTALFDYFFNTDSPIVPEDGDTNSLTLNANPVTGGGVSKDPDSPTYACNEAVEITASPNEGWDFTGWSGGLISTANPETITMDGDKTITATFSQDQYTITSTVEGEGIVSLVPLKDTYVYSEVITITASPNSGWTFTGWGGDLSGSENPKVVTMTGDLNVTAIFEAMEEPEFRIMLPIIVKTP